MKRKAQLGEHEILHYGSLKQSVQWSACLASRHRCHSRRAPDLEGIFVGKKLARVVEKPGPDSKLFWVVIDRDSSCPEGPKVADECYGEYASLHVLLPVPDDPDVWEVRSGERRLVKQPENAPQRGEVAVSENVPLGGNYFHLESEVVGFVVVNDLASHIALVLVRPYDLSWPELGSGLVYHNTEMDHAGLVIWRGLVISNTALLLVEVSGRGHLCVVKRLLVVEIVVVLCSCLLLYLRKRDSESDVGW